MNGKYTPPRRLLNVVVCSAPQPQHAQSTATTDTIPHSNCTQHHRATHLCETQVFERLQPQCAQAVDVSQREGDHHGSAARLAWWPQCGQRARRGATAAAGSYGSWVAIDQHVHYVGGA